MYFGIASDHVFFTPLLYSRSGQKNGLPESEILNYGCLPAP
jgi:hypothetical protein